MPISRREFAGGLAAVPFLAQSRSSKPNIVLIVADDLGWGDLGCYGQERIRTPNIDRLASEGTRFTQVYSGSTVCAPSRCGLMTGLHTGHNRVRDNLPQIALRPGDLTVAELLKSAGYRAGGFGKWGLGNPGTTGIPTRKGFDEWFGYLNQDHAHFAYPQHLWDNENEVFLRGNRGGARGDYAPDLLAERALSFIERHRQNPFFLFFATTLPHFSDYPKDSPRALDVPSDAPYSGKAWPQLEKNYAAMITRLDQQVGRVMELLSKSSLDQNTLVLFSSDNGPSTETAHQPEFFNSNGPWRGTKREMYEGAIRVPMIARWPGMVRAGQVSHHPWAFWDFLPTAAELAGARPPSGVDGVSVLPTLLGRAQPPHEYFYWEYGHVRERFQQAVRAGDWKAVRNSVRGPIELYNLKDDPGETQDVAAQHADAVARMRKILQSARTESQEFPVREKA